MFRSRLHFIGQRRRYYRRFDLRFTRSCVKFPFFNDSICFLVPHSREHFYERGKSLAKRGSSSGEEIKVNLHNYA